MLFSWEGTSTDTESRLPRKKKKGRKAAYTFRSFMILKQV